MGRITHEKSGSTFWSSLFVTILVAFLLYGVAQAALAGYRGFVYVHKAHAQAIQVTEDTLKNATAGAQAFNYLASPVKLPDGREVALGDILAQVAQQAVKAGVK